MMNLLLNIYIYKIYTLFSAVLLSRDKDGRERGTMN